MGITVLGPMTVNGSGRVSPRDRVVLQALATRLGRPVSADELMDALWGDQPPPSAVKILQGCIVRLRKELGAEAIETAPHGYVLRIPRDHLDALRFERLVIRARELLSLGEADRVAYQLTEALALWNGAAFAELPEWEPAVTAARRLDELRLEAEELRVEAHVRSGRHREVLAEAQALVRNAPLRERRWTLLALAQYQAGNQGEALRTIHQLKSVLLTQLGIDPGPDVDTLEQAILRQDASLLSGALVGVSASSCPWQGLRSYDVDDAERFFGRDDEVDACLDIVGRTSFLALVGPSGSGKSSILRAGVAAVLKARGRPVITVTPGRHPLESLSALDRTGKTAVLCVDQGEEVFSLCEDPDERRDFLRVLTEQAEVRPVLVAIRADRLADVASDPTFSRLVEQGLYLVGALDHDGLRRAVEGPARQAGLIIEPGLVDVLVREVQDDPGALPLLSHALLETWKLREGNTLTLAGYHASGGIRDAVAQSAERLYARVEPANRHLLRDLVLRLVSPGTQGEPVRARVPRRLIATDPEHDKLIELLVGARLVTSDDGVLEVTHEALARAWPRLRGWLDDDVEGQRTLHHLASAADAWETLGRPDSELYRGVRLARVLDWQSRTASTLTATERDFLAAGRAASEAEEQTAAERARAQARLIHRLRLVLTGAVVLLVLALAAGGIAAVQSDRASDNAARALTNETAAEARRVGTLALATDDLDESMLLAVAGVRLDDSPETRSNLQAALARRPELMASTQMAGTGVVHLDVSPDGRRVATYDFTNQVRLYEIGTGELLAEYSAGTDLGRSWTSGQVAFSPDGLTLAVLGAAPTRQPVRLLDAATLEPTSAQPLGPRNWRWQPVDLAFSQDGRHLAAMLHRVEGRGDTKRRTSVWAAAWSLTTPGPSTTPTTLFRLEDDPDYAGLVLSRDGRIMVTTLPLKIHDLQAGTSREVAGRDKLERMAISPDGRLLAATEPGAGLVLLDARTGELVRRLRANVPTWFIEFSGDGSRVATVSFQNQEAIVWSVASGRQLARVPLGESGESLDLSPDGSTLYTAGSGNSLRHWDLDGDRRFLSQVAASKPEAPEHPWGTWAQPAPGGELVALNTRKDVMFFDVASGASGDLLDRGNGYSRDGTWHPDGVRFALAAGGEVRVWDARRGKLVGRARPSGRYISGVDYSTDGTRLVIAELSGRVTMLDATTLAPVGRAVRLGQPVGGVAAGPDNGTAIALTGRLDASRFFVPATAGWSLMDLESGTVLAEGALGIDGTHVDYSPDGQHAAVAGTEGEVLVLDLEAGAPLRPPADIATQGVYFVTYSPDGTRILASGDAASVALLDGETGLPLARVVTPERDTTAVFGKDPDSVLISTHFDGPVWEWDTDVGHAVEFACRVAGRGFTKAEWSAHFGDRPYRETCPNP